MSKEQDTITINAKDVGNIAEIMDTEPVDVEKEARINALQQLLGNTQSQVIQAYEGQMTLEEYETLKERRKAWRDELAVLQGEDIPPQENMTPDLILAALTNQQVVDAMLGITGGEKDRLEAADEFRRDVSGGQLQKS